jgi:hypothetical protein
MQRFVGYVATKRGLAGALKLGDGDHAELFAYVRARIETAVAGLLEAAATTDRVRSDVDPVLIMRALSGICLVGDSAEEQVRRLIALLMDGLRFGAPANTAAPNTTAPNTTAK